MAITEAQICNLALLRVGQRRTIDSLTEATEEAQACAVLYPQVRDGLLTRWPWPWATKHAVLGLLDGVTRSGWTYAYAVPTDMLAARYIYAGARPGAIASAVMASAITSYWPPYAATIPVVNGQVPDVPFALELSDDGSKPILLTDQTSAELVYTVKVRTVVAMPPAFQDAVAWGLSKELALALAVKPQLAASFDSKAEQAAQRAWAEAMNHQQADPPPDSEFISVRA